MMPYNEGDDYEQWKRYTKQTNSAGLLIFDHTTHMQSKNMKYVHLDYVESCVQA